MLACALISKVESAAAHKQESAVRLFFCRNYSGVLHPRYGVVKPVPIFTKACILVANVDVIAIVAFAHDHMKYKYGGCRTHGLFLIHCHVVFAQLAQCVLASQPFAVIIKTF